MANPLQKKNPTYFNTFVRSSVSSPDSSFSSFQDQDNSHKILNSFIWLHSDYSHVDFNELPSHFEPQWKEWKQWLTPIQDQGTCGSCWAFASVNTFTDRFNIWARQKYHSQPLSPTLLIICNDLLETIFSKDKTAIDSIQNPFQSNLTTYRNAYCNGNSLIVAYLYLQIYGTTTQTCFPYNTDVYLERNVQNYLGIRPSLDTFAEFLDVNLTTISKYNPTTAIPSCYYYNTESDTPFSFCINTFSPTYGVRYGSPAQHFNIFYFYTIGSMDERWIRYEIWKFGPICSSFLVYEDFYRFDPSQEKVYIHDPRTGNNPIGGHAVEIVGWGEIDEIPFWWIKNSFGTDYGQGGYFRFLRGKNHCGIEENILCCIPNLFVDFNDKIKIQIYIQQILQGGYFKVSPSFSSSRFIDLMKKIMQTFSYDSQYITSEIWNHLFQNYGTISFQILQTSSFLQDNYELPTGFTSNAQLLFPGLNYTSPRSIQMPLSLNEFHTSTNPPRLSSSVKPSSNKLWILCLFLFLLFWILWFLIIFYSKIKK